MSIISYAQNFEDVMLHRALKNIEKGFYIDVGANDPEIDSVTKAFYDMGWRGINIEPVSEWHEKLQQHRPRDINLQVAAGAGEGEITLFEIPQTGLSTTDEEIANRHKKEHGYEIISKQVPVKTLRDICTHYHVAPIHFLKVDVEGGEKAVLEGIDFKDIRPWIILIESTSPSTQTENYQDWEQLILEANYQFAYFDGLNRFYLANEHSELVADYQTPPNYFDHFQLAETVHFCANVALEKKQLTLRLDENEHQLSDSQAALENAREEISGLTSDVQARETELKEVQHQLSDSQAALENAREEISGLTSDVQARETELSDVHKQLNESLANAHHWWLQADSKGRYIQQLHTSTSWRITWPVRAMKRLLISLTNQVVKLIKAIIRPVIILSMRAVLKNPSLRYKLNNVLNRYPRLYRHLHLFALNRGMVGRAQPNHHEPLNDDKKTIQSTEDIETKLSAITPRAREIYTQLKHAIEQKRNV